MTTLQSGKPAAALSPDQIRQYRKEFELFDLNGDGVISSRELAKVTRKLGYRLTDEQIQSIMKENDLDMNGFLSFDEFLKAMPRNMSHISPTEHKKAGVRRMFMEYDKDGNGYVTIDEAHNILRKELAFSPQQTIELVKRYDKNNDYKLSYEEFIEFYAKVKAKADQLKDMFHQFDTDHSDSISVEEAKIMLRRLDMSDGEIELLVQTHDTNRDGELQYHEFVGFLLQS